MHVEGGIPGVDVADGGGAEFIGRMRVGENFLAQRGISGERAPVLAEGDEELLIVGETILGGRRFAAERRLVAIVGGRDSGDVSDILGQGLLAVDGEIGERFVGVILGGELGGGGFKVFQVLRASTSFAGGLWNRMYCLRCRRCG